MTGPLTHITLKYFFSAIAFTMALLLTPRALVDNATGAHVDGQEIPVQLLERPEDCLWCTPPPTYDSCESDDIASQHWLNPDQAPRRISAHPARMMTPLSVPAPEGARGSEHLFEVTFWIHPHLSQHSQGP
ncbi:hypothetical protein DL240_11915 [Lujinxingia litoralis]|uniref:Uncharacterized protein n=1 Tax=Lujinxingia litoralis TaxID=2211119 RepID=A0A328C5T0_9DELT|nr:hypothetical protein [Lujinxingia litoralis]RAL21557.1 hypothetical protein DL240_11915 [Lujinxingia litoralis]